MNAIIAGTRTIMDYELVKQAIKKSSFEITGIVSGKAPGVDTLGERYAKEHDLPIYDFPADWDNIDKPGAVVKYTKYGKPYNAVAGHDRNEEMAVFADALIAISLNQSKGTKNMIDIAKKKNLMIYLEEYKNDNQVNKYIRTKIWRFNCNKINS